MISMCVPVCVSLSLSHIHSRTHTHTQLFCVTCPLQPTGDSVYSRLMTAIGKPDKTADNPLYATNSDRVTRVDEIMSDIADYCAAHTIGENRIVRI